MNNRTNICGIQHIDIIYLWKLRLPPVVVAVAVAVAAAVIIICPREQVTREISLDHSLFIYLGTYMSHVCDMVQHYLEAPSCDSTRK